MGSDSDNLNIVVGPDRTTKFFSVLFPLGLATTLASIAFITEEQVLVITLCFAVMLFLISTATILSLRTRYRATEKGLFIRGVRSDTCLPWNTLTVVGLRRFTTTGNPHALRITNGQRTFSLSSSGVDRNFTLLTKELIRRAAPIPAATLPAQVRSRTSRWLGAVVVLMFCSLAITLAVLGIRESSVFAVIIAPMGFIPIAFIFWELRRTIHGIEADSAGVTLKLGFRTRHIPWDHVVIHRLEQSSPDAPISQLHIQDGAAHYVTDALLVNSAAFQPIAKLLVQRGHLHRWNEIPSDPECFVRLSRWYLFPQLWTLVVVFAGLAWLLAYFELSRETWLGVAFCCSALLACVVYTFVHSINALHAAVDGLHIAAPFRRVFIPWAQLHVTQCHRESPEGRIVSIRFGTPPKFWSLNLFHNHSQQVHTLCNIILTRAAHSPPLFHGHRDSSRSV